MSDIIVRFEKPECDCCVPEGGKAWLVHYGGSAVSFGRFQDAREYAKHANGGKLPRIPSDHHAHMFPDRICVYCEDGTSWIAQRGTGDCDRHPDWDAAMTAAHELAKGELRDWIAGPEFAGGIANDELGEQFDRAIAKRAERCQP